MKVPTMPNVRLLSIVLLCGVSSAGASEALPQGAYAITATLEIPNINAPPWQATRYVCLDPGKAVAGLPVPVLSPNNPYGSCTAEALVRTPGGLRYHIACPGRGSARADASYLLSPDGFRGRIAMVLGAKNMTLTETQIGHRLGDCAPATATAQP